MNLPTDDQFFSKTEKGKPDIAFLKNHFYREGRIREEHALHIIEKATEILHAEPNLLHVDAPVTGELFSTARRYRTVSATELNGAPYQSVVIFTDNMCVSDVVPLSATATDTAASMIL